MNLITFTGLDYPSFAYLLNNFEPLYHRGAHGRRQGSFDVASCLRLALEYTTKKGLNAGSPDGIWLIHSVLCLFLKFLMLLSFKVLVAEPYALLSRLEIKDDAIL